MTDELSIRVERSFTAISPESWSRLSGASKTCAAIAYNPFVSHAFLSSLEESGSADAETGWLGHHLLLETGRGELIGALPGYLKNHSQGEYVFDHGWADAFERAGGRYYPKLQCSIPFTPATGPRLLVAEGLQRLPIQSAIAESLKEVVRRLGISSAHITFVPDEEIGVFEMDGYLHRTDQQFHFINDGYANHEDFLETLASRKRKALRKERRAALENGISIDWLTGRDLTERIWDQFFKFYMDTGGRKWGRPYLTRKFYSLIGERMADDILLVMAKRDGRYIAGAINFIGGDTLYGRHWGCIEDHPFLHFEVCYHQAIDFALSKGLKRVEAGAQGEHKLARGYLPVTTHSAHYVAHAGLRRAIGDYLARERADVEQMSELLTEHSPFRKGERQQED
ncbi:GNAT family N-acetyltransferase [Rhizobium leguminosarum bv. viciae 248]|uniref:GNAT family N-acetyltransferase n=1 Tax=Rhizobium leguminosarum TaxID=384 RepID=UPI0003632E9B|nr:GNAT family N-acetyltransferase [Rhizobium leguminosarum]MBY5837730.1 GNAT family N-acetyltransferase [Rhizobium leguminosarum]MCA2411567.1 GNAT family N-acetyltransferase [Rhizobium leguminosarum]NKL78023.1 GNAT family N-acetyltransferase [Rhizobium leguminosarum bv. viciae]NKM64763.1 GNAT family N-acetyltransferase [Rhizobium leguminosarum bv. viciae]NKM76349.1 GNAT family N-acetyltransferase [Rhizobium leguminosarum bv. viciae]